MSAIAPLPGTNLSVRLLSAGDLPRVLEIERAAFSTPWRESTFRGLLQRGDTDMIAAVRDGKVIGYAIAWTVVDQSELGNVAVAPEARGTGVGRLLVRAILERLRYRRASECFLEVRASNVVAQRLYRSLGFQEIGRRRAYYSEPVEDALVMRLAL